MPKDSQEQMDRMKDSDVSIIIPAHDEVQSIGAVISNIRSLHPDFEIIVVDDGSTGGTGKEAKNQGALVYRNDIHITSATGQP